jgi:hypothetical protein
MLVVFEAMRRAGAVVNDDVLYGFRMRLFSLAAELGNVRQACRIFNPSVDLLPLAGTGPALGPGDPPAARATAEMNQADDKSAIRASRARLARYQLQRTVILGR